MPEQMLEATDSDTDNASAYETCRFSISVYVMVGFAFADHSRGPVGWLPGKDSCRWPILEGSSARYWREGHGGTGGSSTNRLFSVEPQSFKPTSLNSSFSRLLLRDPLYPFLSDLWQVVFANFLLFFARTSGKSPSAFLHAKSVSPWCKPQSFLVA